MTVAATSTDAATIASRDGDRVLFNTTEGETYLVPDAPADLPEDTALNIFGWAFREVGAEFMAIDWESIDVLIAYPDEPIGLEEPIIIDEPFSGLDPVNTRLVKQIFEEQRAAGKTIIMSTHQMHQVEALCNRIVLINRGHSVLYGLVNEIKRNFAGNAIVLEGQGDFSQVPGVLDVRQHNGTWEMGLQVGTDPQAVLQQLLTQPDNRITRFELAEPSLDDIFVQVVGRSNQ